MSHKHAKYKLAIVTWHDAFGIGDNHVDTDDAILVDPFVRHSVGWLVKRRPVVLAQTFDGKGIASTLTIPRGIVRRITVMDVVDDED